MYQSLFLLFSINQTAVLYVCLENKLTISPEEKKISGFFLLFLLLERLFLCV